MCGSSPGDSLPRYFPCFHGANRGIQSSAGSARLRDGLPVVGAWLGAHHWVVQRWLDRWGIVASFAWGLAEGTLFFVVPDVVVGAVAIVAPRKALWAAIAAVGGAAVAGIVWWVAASTSSDAAVRIVDAVPAVHTDMFEEVAARISTSGGAALLGAPFSGIAYKVWAIELALRGWAPAPLLLWTVAGRALRLVPVALLAAAGGWAGRRWLRLTSRTLLVVWGAGWTALYAVYWSRTGF